MPTRDINPKPVLTVSSIPTGSSQSTLGTSASISAGSYVTFNISTIPTSNILGLWNYSWSLFVDALDIDHLWPRAGSVGTSISNATMSSLVVSSHTDLARSDDTTNLRVNQVTILNNDASPHVFYLEFKAYTFASIPGSGGVS